MKVDGASKNKNGSKGSKKCDPRFVTPLGDSKMQGQFVKKPQAPSLGSVIDVSDEHQDAMILHLKKVRSKAG